MPEIVSEHPLEKLFSTFDEEDQAKVMRLTRDRERRDRFIENFDKKKFHEVQRRIKGEAIQLNKTVKLGTGGRESKFVSIKEEVDQEEPNVEM